MNRTNRTNRISQADSAFGGLDRQSFNGASGFSYRAHAATSRQLFAAPPVDLTTLVIAQEIKRRAQAELQREVLRDSAYRYDMPVQQERNDRNNERNNTRNDERGGSTNPADFDE